jgi:hypothetical protein
VDLLPAHESGLAGSAVLIDPAQKICIVVSHPCSIFWGRINRRFAPTAQLIENLAERTPLLRVCLDGRTNGLLHGFSRAFFNLITPRGKQ